MKALVGAFNQEKALVGAFSVIVQPVVEPMDRFAALVLVPCWMGVDIVFCSEALLGDAVNTQSSSSSSSPPMLTGGADLGGVTSRLS